ncbi:hypothetical protein D9V32_11380 [Mycetocola tolaasinivorans]|uniref:Uncharacterized protein n=1 Tax=Mycetocola tolaasinivorans TaxID=76635 RepID=A0A3L7A485_9MICO|nr:hypothetical protein D9V32_11380 [Mycetocola tolaasinivorans]
MVTRFAVTQKEKIRAFCFRHCLTRTRLGAHCLGHRAANRVPWPRIL